MLVLVGWVTTTVLAQDDGGTDRAAERERALATIRAEIARLETKLAGLRTRETSLSDRLDRTTTELRLQEERLSEATAERDWAEQRLSVTRERVAALEVVVENVRGDLARRLDGMYRLGRGGYLRLALSLDERAPVLPALRQLRYLARRDREALERYRTARTSLDIEQRHLESARSEAERWHAEEASRRAELDRVRQEQAGLLTRVQREKRAVADRAAVLEEQALKLATLISALVDRSGAPLEGRPITGFKGVLDWPVDGKVSVPFGPRRDPRYRTEVPHNGIDLDTTAGAEVRTVYPGKVLYAAVVEGFGQTVVVHHAGQVFSLYAGLAEASVTKDDVLGSERVIGTAGDTLYFEIRQQNQPEDPLGWLRSPTLR